MSEGDFNAVDDVLEDVITKTVSQQRQEEEEEEHESIPTPLSLDYGDSDEPGEKSKENHENENGNGGLSNGGISSENDEDVVMVDEVNCRITNGGGGDIDDGSDEDPEYVVEKVLEKKVDEGILKYLVKWKNYPASSNTWEPAENLADCDKVVIQFETRKAEDLAEKHASEEDEKVQTNQPSSTKRKQKQPLKEFMVNDVMGITMVGDEKFFLVSLSDSTQKVFIRASLANRIVPHKVIDFYVKNMKWKSP